MANKQGRKKTSGNFPDRKELEAFVLFTWDTTRKTAVDIGLAADVSPQTVRRILRKAGREIKPA